MLPGLQDRRPVTALLLLLELLLHREASWAAVLAGLRALLAVLAGMLLLVQPLAFLLEAVCPRGVAVWVILWLLVLLFLLVLQEACVLFRVLMWLYAKPACTRCWHAKTASASVMLLADSTSCSRAVRRVRLDGIVPDKWQPVMEISLRLHGSC
jgi:hypothetical protein